MKPLLIYHMCYERLLEPGVTMVTMATGDLKYSNAFSVGAQHWQTLPNEHGPLRLGNNRCSFLECPRFERHPQCDVFLVHHFFG